VLEFTILGPLEARRDGRALDLGGARQRAVLALLLLRAGESVPAARLIDDIWGERPPDTATNVLQSYVSKLRRELGRDSIVTRANGYAVVIPDDALDLRIFERRVAAANASPTGEAATALRSALALWRGTPLAEFADQPWAGTAAARLVDMRLAASERALELDLELGHHADVLGEIAQLVAEHPLREQLRRLQLIALYRCGRQADALDAYRQARALLVDQLGIEPGPALREVEQAILRHDEALAAPSTGAKALPPPAEEQRSILVAPQHDAAILPLCSIAEPLARNPRRELIAVRLIGAQDDLARPTADLAALRDELSSRGLAMRVAAYTSTDPAADLVQLATAQESDLLLLDAPAALLQDGAVDETLGRILRDAPCDVAVLAGPAAVHREATRPVVVPFGGNENDWSALELAAWTARALGTTLRLVGTSADRFRGRRDASRLLGKVSLLVQAVVGIVAEPVLVKAGPDGLIDVAREAELLVLGLSPRWQAEGLGTPRLEVVQAGVPTLLVRRGLRPGALAPRETMTRFTWTMAEA
jgi:DNA-binding SARP family transcriptional activator